MAVAKLIMTKITLEQRDSNTIPTFHSFSPLNAITLSIVTNNIFDATLLFQSKLSEKETQQVTVDYSYRNLPKFI